MTDNLIERLREYCDGNNDLMDAAADRIKKLEAALLEIRNWNVAYYWNDAGPLASHMQSVASKALEEKDD